MLGLFRFWWPWLALVALCALLIHSRSAEAAWMRPPAAGEGRETVASCYGEGDGFAGGITASGEVFDPHELTTAHRSLPFGEIVWVHHGERSVPVRVTDRGPFVTGREFDLSCGAMRLLGLPPGVYPVSVS